MSEPLGVSLTLVGLALMVVIYVLPQNKKPPTILVAGLAVIFGLLVFPIWHLPWVSGSLGRRVCGLIVLGVIVGLLGKVCWPRSIRILLTPGTHPSPPTPFQPLLPDDIVVFLGDSAAVTRKSGAALIGIDNEVILSFNRQIAGISINAIVRDAPNRQVVTIVNNVVNVVSRGLEVLNPDPHNVVVLGKGGCRVLSIRYVNDTTMILSGTFYGKRSGPFVVADGGPIQLPNGITLSRNFFRNYGGPVYTLDAQRVSVG
jgi:hypothetical protein